VAAPRDVPSVRLAVRSETERFPLGHGLESLLEILTVRPAQRFLAPSPALPPGGPLAEFEA